MSKQTHRASAIETVSNTAFGLLISTIANWLLLPLWGYHLTVIDSFNIGVVFTLISLIRGYVFRRLFETLRTTGVLP